jgi:phenylacetate-CoA ligase
VLTEPPRWRAGQQPSWLGAYLDRVRQVVPLYRRADPHAETLSTSRDDLARAWWELVPDDVELDELIWFPTSGSGHAPVVVPTHPVTVSSYYPLLLEVGRWHGISLRLRPDRADWITVIDQHVGGFTVPSWSSVLGCGTAQVNLDESRWRAGDDRRRFLERHDPQVITGDPVSLSHLADLDATLHPRLLISTALHLAGATKQRLEARFGCPAVDVYSTTESGPIAASRPAGGMALLQPRLYVEITSDDGMACPPGSPGIVTLTGGINRYLPLLRYRTGDTARLSWAGDQPLLEGLSGRAAVMLRTADQRRVSSFDVTQLLRDLPLRRWSVHQRADGSLVVAREPESTAGGGLDARITAVLQGALGTLEVSLLPLSATGKVTPFTVEEPR